MKVRLAHPVLLPIGAGIAAWLVLSAPVLAPDLQLGERDTARLLYPVERTVAAALRAGRLPFWDPHVESGASILGQVTPAALHPFALLYLALPFGLAFKLEHLLALLLGGCGAALLARELGASRWSALFAAIAFGGSGALVSSASAALPYALGPAAAPLAIAGVLRFLRGPSSGSLFAAGFALALCAFGGDPQSFGITILVGVVVAMFERPRPRRALLVLAWAACGLLLCAPAALPAVAQLQRSARKSGISEAERKAFSTPPVRLFGVAVPLAFDGGARERGAPGDTYEEFLAKGGSPAFLGSICVGAPALLLALASARRRRVAPLLGLFVLFVVASTGSAGHVQPLLEAAIPGWRLFRFTEKFLLHASWLVAASAAVGVEEALLGVREKALPLVWLAAAATLVGAAFLAIFTTMDAALLRRLVATGLSHSSALARYFLDSLQAGMLRATALSAAICAAGILRYRRPASLAPAGLAAAAAAASALLAPPLRTVRADLYEGTSATARKLFELGGPSLGRWRVLTDAHRDLPLLGPPSLNLDEKRLVGFREGAWPQLQALDGIEGAAPYFSAEDPEYRAVLERAPRAALDLLAIRFYVVPRGPDAPRTTLRSDSGFGILERPPPPRAFLVHRTVRVQGLEEAIPRLRSMNVHEEALVPEGGPVLDGVARVAPIELTRPAPERIEASVETASPALLVVSEHYDPGWRAEVDGAAVPVHAADVILLGVPVPAGRHEVRLRYVPVGFRAGAACALVAALVLAVLAFRHSPRPYSRIL